MIHSHAAATGATFLLALVAGLSTALAVEPATPITSSTLVAERGGAKITIEDVDATLSRVSAAQRADVMNSPKRIEETLSTILLTRQLANLGYAEGLDRDPLIKHAIAMSAETVVGTQHMLKYREKISLGNLEPLARERYMANPDKFAIPENVAVRHILIDTTSRSDNEAHVLADQIRTRAQSEEFEALVAQYSDDPSKGGNRGRIDEASSAKMDPQFAEASGKLRTVGEIGPVVKSQFGYHVIKLISRSEPQPRSFDEVKESIITELRTSMTETRVKEYVDQLRSMSLEANPDAVLSLRTRYVPAATSPAAATPAPSAAKN